MGSPSPEETVQGLKMIPEFVPLSKYSQYHLDAATPGRTQTTHGLVLKSILNANGPDTISTISPSPPTLLEKPSPGNGAHDLASSFDAENTSQDITPTHTDDRIFPILTNFSLFGELPAELQDQIWKTAMQPRIVELRAREVEGHLYAAQRPIKMWNVSKKHREETLSAFGYMVLTIPARHEGTSPCTFLINPNIDVLYISIWTDYTLNHQKLLESISTSNITKIRCVALDYTETRDEDDAMNDWIRKLNLQSFSSLELVFIVLQAQNQGWPQDSGMLSRFEVFTDEDSVKLKEDFPWIAPDVMTFKEELQRAWARGPKGIFPRIVFVEEFYKRPVYWDLADA